MKHPAISRRAFLSAASFGAASLATFRLPLLAQAQGDAPIDPFLSYDELYQHPPMLGRVVQGAIRLRVFVAPDRYSQSVGNVFRHDVIPIYRAVRGTDYDNRAHSTVWFETTDGNYVHSAYVAPCQEHFQTPAAADQPPFWAEVTVPLGWQHQEPRLDSLRWDFDYYRVYYGQVHRIVERTADAAGNEWYRIEDDIEPNRRAWVLARSMRHIHESEFAPISPDVKDKRIEIDLAAQTLTAYEAARVVFRTRVATGTVFQDGEGKEIDFSTPYGDYAVQRKRPSRRMRGGFDIGLGYDVNGVPWCTYFTFTGAAIHGAYWHNNFGTPRSHGCINVTSDAAKWVYRWTAPHVTAEDSYYWTASDEAATTIKIV